MLNIEITNGAGGVEKIDYILKNPNSLVYSNPRFIRLVEAHLNAKSKWLTARRGDTIVGMMPYIISEGAFGAVFNSLAYFGSNGGVIQHSADVEAKGSIIKTFFNEAEEANAASATVISNPLENDEIFYENTIDDFILDKRISQITHLPEVEDEDELIKHFQDPRPRNIRRAIKEGVVIKKRHDESAINFLYDTHLSNMTAIGGLPKKKSFFTSIPKHMKQDEWAIFVASRGGEDVAALLLFYFNNTVEYYTPVITEKYKNTQALALTIYMAMKDAMRDGYGNWNWGGTWLSQGGVYNFKKRWGTSEYCYFYYTKLYNEKIINCTPRVLLENYPGLFVIPFEHLRS